MKYKLIEILCFIFAALFIVYSVSSVRGTDLSASEIGDALSDVSEITELNERDAVFIKKTFGLSSDDYKSAVYYSSDDVMDVREFLAVVFSDTNGAETLKNAVEEYEEDRLDIFASYAPEQGEMLRNKLLYCKGNLLFLYVGNDPDTVKDALTELL